MYIILLCEAKSFLPGLSIGSCCEMVLSVALLESVVVVDWALSAATLKVKRIANSLHKVIVF